MINILVCIISLGSPFFAQSSYPPISPKWVFEPWVWEDTNNTKAATWDLINGYLNRSIPVGAIIIDSPWEWPMSPTDQGYNTFIFDWSKYSQPKQFIQELNNKGIHVILWITGVMTTNCPYYQFAKDSNYFVNNGATTTFWKGNGIASHIDFFNVNAVNYWKRLMNNVLDSMEVDGWKVDESDSRIAQLNPIITAQGNKTTREYSDAYYSAIYNYTLTKRGNKGMITARPYCKQKNDTAYYNAPISVNTAGWVGDQEHTWDGLNLALKNIFISANAGYAAVGSDIGGYAKEIDYATYIPPNKNLFIRWAQFGALVPIMENGGQSNKQHQPWLFDSPTDSSTVRTYRYYAKLHHHLVPYLYSYDIAAHLTKTSIMRPIGPDINAWTGKWNYLLGDNLFVSAISVNSNTKSITFPTGTWIDYWNEDNVYQGGNTETLNYNLDKYPIFIKSGAIIPMNVDDSETGYGSAASENYLTLLMYPTGLSTFEYHSDPSTTTMIKCDERCGGFIISFNRSVDSVIIRLKNKVEPESVLLSGNINLPKRNSFADFEGASSGWFYGKLRDGENVYTWIKFSNSTDTVKVITTSVSNITPNNYELSKLDIGNKYYVDRDFTITSFPDEYKNLNMIKTANDDKITVNLIFNFNTCSKADIFIAYDHRLNAPTWIKNYYDSTGKKIYVSDQYAEYFNIWKKSVFAGTVTLGDNQGTSESSMYFIFIESFLDPPLPVELSNLEAIIEKDNCVILQWETKTEVNNYGFEMERKLASGGLEVGGWAKIGFVQGSGNSNSPKEYSFMDKKLNSGKYSYRLKMIDNDGTFKYSDVVEVEVGLPKEYAISQNYPNPFNPTTRIDYQLPFDSKVTIELYGITGERVGTLINNELSAGYYTLGVNANTLSLASGVYFCRMVAQGLSKQSAKTFIQIKKLMLIK